MPKIQQSNDGGVGILKSLGMNRNDLRDLYGKYGKFAAKVPFLNNMDIDSMYNNLDQAMANDKTKPTSKPLNNKKSSFDRGKYFENG